MPLFDKFRDSRLRAQARLRQRELELIQAEKDSQEAIEREEEARRRDAAFQAAITKQKEEELEEYKRRYGENIHLLEAGQLRNGRDAQLQLVEERKKREEIAQREHTEAAHRRDEIQKEEAQREIEKEKAKMKFEEKQLEEKLLQAEKKRDREDLLHCNSAKALHELRNLIRLRYELDMDIWSMRGIGVADRNVVEKKMAKSDEILHLIRSRVENWSAESGWDELEWEYAAEVKERLLADGKRIWADDPPWPKPMGKLR
jgi:hypothetical protein